MPGSWSLQELPYLTEDACVITSPVARRYNCIAWAAGEDVRWWWPDPMGIGYWPPNVPREITVPAFMQAYEMLGYALCFDDSLQAGVEKVCIFGYKEIDGSVIPTHAALQLESGEWTSKLGPLEDIRHNILDSLNGPLYGKAICYMFRPRPAPNA